MGLRSMGLAVTTAAMAAVLLAVTLWLWPRLARRDLTAAGLRALLLCALQASVVGSVFLAVNRSLEFYSSWPDLLGTTTVSGTIVAAHQGGAPTVARPAAALATAKVAVPWRPRVNAGRLVAVRFHGQVSGITTRGFVYLPPTYSTAGPPLPVIVVISGQAGSAGAVYGAPRVAVTAAAQILARHLPPAIVAVLSPSVTTRAGRGCLDVPGGPQVATFFSQDLPQILQRSYRGATAASRWAVLGVAGGGYCALQLATAASDPFSIAVAPEASYAAPPGGDLIPPGTAVPGGAWVRAGPALRNQDSVTWRLQHRPSPPVRVLLTGPGPAGKLLPGARPPMRVTAGGLAPGPRPLAPVFGWIGRALRSES